MAVHIRLARAGTTKVPYYRVVATDQRCPRGGRFIERLGTWDPRRTQLTLDRLRVSFWLERGAQPTATVARLLKNAAKLGVAETAASAAPATAEAKS